MKAAPVGPVFGRVNGVAHIPAYFAEPSRGLDFISSGCTLLDCMLGGGYPLGRITNLVGDKSSGKTLLAIEAMANFAQQYEDGHIWLCESEAALDESYARALGMPVDRITRADESIDTVEGFFRHIMSVLDKRSAKPGLYVLDSLDALSDEKELKADLGDAGFGVAKAKLLSEAFRKLVKRIEASRVSLIVISQVRQNISATFGRKYTRSGGKALDFYSSQIVFLAHIKTLNRTRNNIERPIGVRIRAKCDKNKVGLPFRECEFPIRFGFGVDDITAGIEWLEEIKRVDALHALAGRNLAVLKSAVDRLDDSAYVDLRSTVSTAVRKVWTEVETTFLPRRVKYAH